MKEKEKTKQASVYSIYLYIYIPLDYMMLYYMIYIYDLLQWMQRNIYRDVFPTFLTKKSYG